MKRTLSLVLALVMILGTFTTVFAATEAETTAAEFLADEKILLGADGDLMLDKNLERRDAVVLLSRLLGVEEVAKVFPISEESPSFEDARTDAYYVPFIAWAEANGYFEGDDEGNFNPRNAITAQEYALVLLRALEYDVKGNEAWKAALETAEKAGLLKDVEVEDKDEVVRGQMAAMTFNALGAKINGSDETLAEKLGIEMPEAEVTELTADVLDTENLAEIVVELSSADLVSSIERLENASNYRLNDNSIEVKEAKVEGDNVVLTLMGLDIRKDESIADNTKSLVKNRKYTLTIRGIDRDINGSYDFKAYDNTAPAIESVVALGEYGIKVTTTEPVANVKSTDFRINNRVVTMNVEQYGRDIILTPYGSAKFALGENELTVSELKDFASYRSSAMTETFDVATDDVAPEVVSATRARTGRFVVVEFDKEVRDGSIGGYSNYKNLGNISYRDGRQTVYAETKRAADNTVIEPAAKKIANNVVVYRFEKELPRNVEFTIEGVENYSKVVMEKELIIPTISLEDEVAEVVNNEGQLTFRPATETIINGNKITKTEVVIKFDKNVNKPSTVSVERTPGVSASAVNLFADNFRLFERYVDSRYALTELTDLELEAKIAAAKALITTGTAQEIQDKKDAIKSVDGFYAITDVDYNTDIKGADIKNELVVTVLGLNRNNTQKAYDYILEMFDLTDADSNKIARTYLDFQVSAAETLTVGFPKVNNNVVASVYASEATDGESVSFKVQFTAKVNKDIAENAENYVFAVGSRNISLDGIGEAYLHNDGVTLTIRIDKSLEEIHAEGFNKLTISPTLRTLGGTLIGGDTTFTINTATNKMKVTKN